VCLAPGTHKHACTAPAAAARTFRALNAYRVCSAPPAGAANQLPHQCTSLIRIDCGKLCQVQELAWVPPDQPSCLQPLMPGPVAHKLLDHADTPSLRTADCKLCGALLLLRVIYVCILCVICVCCAICCCFGGCSPVCITHAGWQQAPAQTASEDTQLMHSPRILAVHVALATPSRPSLSAHL
jgi:hypothetical protein